MNKKTLQNSENKSFESVFQIALVGNPNTGKTTFYNTLTNSNEHIGNWHGVTVDYKEKVFEYNKQKVKLTDLPGIYSLTNYSFEESIARDYIYNHNQTIINICDANNLARNLYLTLQLIELGINPILCVNMANELKKQKRKLNYDLLSKKLGFKVFLINANKKSEVNRVLEYALNNSQSKSIHLSYLNSIKTDEIENILAKNKLFSFNRKYVSIKIIEQDDYFLSRIPTSLRKQIESYSHSYQIEDIAKIRYKYIDTILKDCFIQEQNKTYGISKLDRFVLNKWLALPIFLVIISLIFFLTFSSIGSFLSGLLSDFIHNCIASPVTSFVESKTSNAYLVSFIKDGVFGGVGSLVSFLPQIVLLFLSLSILEESGYLSRLAFTLEDYFSKIGLTGKSVFTLLMGFGCSTTATMTCRNLEDKNSKIKTAMLSPYISCSAKIPIYTVICCAFFKAKLLVIIGLYLLSVLVAILVSLILEKTILKSGEQSFIMELPPYRFPSLKRIIRIVFTNIKSFVLRVGTMIISFSIIIWILQSCDFTFRYNTDNSILKNIGSFLAPIFSPLGFNNWGAVSCLICGIVAKEVIVSTMGIINNISSESVNSNLLLSQSLMLSTSNLFFTPSTAFSFLVFSLLYAPCISTIGVLFHEIGKKWTITSLIIQFSVAYIITFVLYRIYICFEITGVLGGIIASVIFILITISLGFLYKFFKNKNKCKLCPNKKSF